MIQPTKKSHHWRSIKAMARTLDPPPLDHTFLEPATRPDIRVECLEVCLRKPDVDIGQKKNRRWCSENCRLYCRVLDFSSSAEYLWPSFPKASRAQSASSASLGSYHIWRRRELTILCWELWCYDVVLWTSVIGWRTKVIGVCDKWRVRALFLVWLGRLFQSFFLDDLRDAFWH